MCNITPRSDEVGPLNHRLAISALLVTKVYTTYLFADWSISHRWIKAKKHKHRVGGGQTFETMNAELHNYTSNTFGFC